MGKTSGMMMNDLVTTCVFERERERERERFYKDEKKIKRTFLIVIRKKEENKI